MTTNIIDKAAIAQRIAEVSLLHGDFTLRSGRKSKYYLDKYLFSTQPDVLASLGKMFATLIDAKVVNRLAGAELGGIPLVTVASLETGLPCIFVRNQKKDYGTAQQIEGSLNKGDNIVIVEDIATTGGQVLEAAQMLTALGANIIKIIATIDREEGARENVEGAGFVFESLFTKSDLGINE